jgi:hypothetical protein
MPVTDFLFEGRPPPSVSTYGQTVESMPKWLSDYTQGLVSRANAIAGEQYQPYGGPRIADFSQDEEAAFDAARANFGSYRPYLNAAGNTLGGGLSQAEGYINQGTEDFPGAAGRYMDPYIGHVLDRNAEMSNRNFTENTMPALQGAFTRAGHFGSDRMMEMANRAQRDTSENLHGMNLAALSGAYGQAGELFGADRNRDLNAGQIAGQLGLEGSRQYGALGEMASRMGYTDAAAMEGVGRTERGMDQQSLDLAYQDFLQQRDYPRNTIDWMSSVIRGMPHDSSKTMQEYGPASVYPPSGLSQLASILSAGAGAYDIFTKKARGGLAQYAEGGLVTEVA